MLRIDGHEYSASILRKILHVASEISSFHNAAVALRVVGEIEISSRQVNKLASEFGQRMARDRDTRTNEFLTQPLPRQPKQAATPIELAAVFFDGGRMRTRQNDSGPGVHEPHWRETKNAGFHRMHCKPSAEDPQPDLPDCLCNRPYVEKLVKGLKNTKKEGAEETVSSETSEAAPDEAALQEVPEWQPETLFRTTISSLTSSEEFGPMMAAEADARGFYTAQKKAFLGDGLLCNWRIQERWFADFTCISDFIHIVEHIYEVAKAVHADADQHWQQYVTWATECWQGRIDDFLKQLGDWQTRLGQPPKDEKLPDADPRKIVAGGITYFTHNRHRMDYPRYRREGLPVTSSLAESLVKQINQRVKGTEKFWNDGPTGEAILQLRAARLSDDDRLQNWIQNRPISPFSPRCQEVSYRLAA